MSRNFPLVNVRQYGFIASFDVSSGKCSSRHIFLPQKAQTSFSRWSYSRRQRNRYGGSFLHIRGDDNLSVLAV